MPYKNLEDQREYWRKKRAEYRGSIDSSRKKSRSRFLSMTQEEWDKRRKEQQHKYHTKMRIDALTHYGGKSPECACCGENHFEFLTIDHINGGGYSARKLGQYGHKLYLWLRSHNYPDGFRVLCWNCNGALGAYGYCPHNKPKIIPQITRNTKRS